MDQLIDTYGAKYDRNLNTQIGKQLEIEVTRFEIRKRTWRDGQRAFNSKPRLYVSPEDFNVLGDMLSGTRYNRPEQDFKATWLTLLRAASGDPDLKIGWSQRAGCTCPCSPGFIVTTTSTKLANTDIWIEYKLRQVK